MVSNMVRLFSIITSVGAKSDLEVTIDDESLRLGMIPNSENPAIMDAYDHGLVVGKVITVLQNPDAKDVTPPPTVVKFGMNQVGSVNKTVYNLNTGHLNRIFPGYTNDPNDTTRINRSNCYLKSNGKCPEGYVKISLQNIRERTDEELASLMKTGKPPKKQSSNGKKKNGKKNGNQGSRSSVAEEDSEKKEEGEEKKENDEKNENDEEKKKEAKLAASGLAEEEDSD